MRYVIIGTGPAGVTAAETLRHADPSGSVALVGDEPGLPYSRMAIPYLLEDKIDERGTLLRRAPGHFERQGIELVHDRVDGIDPTAGRASLAAGGSLSFDRLLIATGSRPLTPDIPGTEHPGVVPCWTLADAREIMLRAVPGARVVLIGAGFIASIILQSLARRGTRLTVIEAAERMVPRMMNATASTLLAGWCQRHGVSVMLSTEVTGITGDAQRGIAVSLGDGSRIEADLVVTAVGVKPNIECLGNTRIRTSRGVEVDEYLETSLPGIYAAGDVAESSNFSTGSRAVHAIQPTAVEHGRIAALNMTGAATAYRGSLGMNVLDTLGLVSASFGRWMGSEHGQSVELHDPDNFRYLNLQFEDDRLVGATTVGHTERIGILRGLIQGRVSLGAWKARLLSDPTRITEAYLARSRMYG